MLKNHEKTQFRYVEIIFPSDFPMGFRQVASPSTPNAASCPPWTSTCPAPETTRNPSFWGEDNSHFFQEWYLNFQSNPPTHISWWNAHMLIETRTLLIKKLHVLPVKPPVPQSPPSTHRPPVPAPSTWSCPSATFPWPKMRLFFWKTGIQPAKKWWVYVDEYLKTI